jgi:excisionase family DNA binding protein
MIQNERPEKNPSNNDVEQSNLPLNGYHLWTIEEVAEYLQLKSETVRAMARERELPAIKIRKRWRFRREDIEQWVNQMAKQTQKRI